MKLEKDNNLVVETDMDIIEMIEKFKEENHDVYWVHIDKQIYIYKPVGRKDFKELCEMDDINQVDKEDELIKRTLLYPNPEVLQDMPAGISSKLYGIIIKNSYLENLEIRTNVLAHFREDMYDMQNQITCIINEAFPQFDIEEIENWGVERTAKYLSRAEWKLVNLRGMNMDESYIMQHEQEMANAQQTSQDDNSNNEKEVPHKIIKGTKEFRDKIEESRRKFPEIDWDHVVTSPDEMMDNVDTTPVALRTPPERIRR